MRVVERLSNSSEAKHLYQRVWLSASALEGSQTENFLKLLAGDILWQTKVAEEVEGEHSWKDLLDIESFKGKLKDWVSSLFEKLGSKEHPAARALTAATLGVTLVVAVKAIGPPDTLTIPVKVVASYDKSGEPLSLGSVNVSLAPVTLEAAKTQAPIQLQLVPDQAPVRVNFVSDVGLSGKPTDALAEVTKKLESSNAVLSQAASSLDAMAKQPVHSDLASLHSSLEGVSQNVFQTTAKLDEVSKGLLDLKKSYEVQSKEEVTTSRDEAQKIDARLGSLAQVGANPQVPWEMTLAENTPRTILLPRFDPTSGREAFKAVVINVHDIQSDGKKKTVRIDQVSADSSDPKPTEIVAVPQPYHEGQGLPLDSKRWRLTVVLIEKHWYGKSSVTLRLVPDESDSANRGSDVAQMK
jgi:hypothetical protein